MIFIDKVYAQDQNREEIMKEIEESLKEEMSKKKVSLKEAITSEEYRRATWVCAFIFVFNQLSGNASIMFYSNTILENLNSDGGGIDPAVGTIIIGLVNFIGSATAVVPVSYLGRKTILLLGHLIMSISLILVGTF